MIDKLNGRAIKSNSIPANKIAAGTLDPTAFAPGVSEILGETARPKIVSISYFGSNTTANINGNQTITLTGAGFQTNIQIYIESNAVPSVTRTNANSVSFTTPAKSAGTYLVYAINTDDGGFATLVPGIVYA